MKKKFRIYFNDGTSMIDKNKYKTIGQVKSWMKAHNKGCEYRDRAVVVEEIKRKIKSKPKSYSDNLKAMLRKEVSW